MSWFWYAIASPFFYTLTTFIDKFLVDRKIKFPIVITVMNGFMMAGVGAILGILGFFQPIPITHMLLIFLAGILMDLYLWPYYKALQRDDASTIMPLYQFIPVFVLFMSAIFLHETVSMRQMIGFLLIILGGFVISVERGNSKIFKPRRALWYMMLSSFLYSCVLVLFRFVTVSYGFWTTLAYEFVGMGIGSCLLLLLPQVRSAFSHEKKVLRSSLGIILTNNMFGLLAQMSEAYALSIAAAPLVSIVISVQPLMVLVLGVVLSVVIPHIIKEDIRRRVVGVKLLMIVLMIIGMYFINT